MGIPCHGLGEPKGSLLGRSEIDAAGPFREMGKLIVSPSQVASQDGVAGEAVGSFIYLAGADDDQLFEPGWNGAGIEDSGKVGLHGGEDLRTVRHDAKHVGHISALSKDFVVKRSDIGGNITAIKPGNS
jgi:hypothetical protein